MDDRKWVEAEGKTVDIATQAALDELGLSSPDLADIEVLQEPQRGLLGFGGRDAIVRVTVRSKRRRRRRGGHKGGGKPVGRRSKESQGARGGSPGRRSNGDSKKGGRGGGGKDSTAGGKDRSQREKRPMSTDKPSSSAEAPARGKDLPPLDHEQQAEIIDEFLSGIVGAFGLDGDIEVRVDDGIIYADVQGEQTEALVGAKGAILQSIHELCRTVVQRKSFHPARIRLDISGYAERRREALKIYAQRLANKVLQEGGEVELEPMNPADRKVVHDAASEIEGVRTFSEGEEPRRRV
ncbi:MAG: RNA-binding cell elongation regulator Jag/EloR, partial [Dehalococcoidia bacterium]